MVASDDVLLLRPVGVPGIQGLGWGAAARDEAGGLLAVTVHLLRRPAAPALVDLLDRCATPALLAAGARVLGWLGTQPEDDQSTVLPVREGLHALVLLCSFTGTEAHREHLDALARSTLWQTVVVPGLEAELLEPPRTSRLTPTRRSRLQHPARSSAVTDFAFLEGEWTVANLRRSAVGSADEPWTRFTSTGSTTLHLGGMAVVEELGFSDPPWQGLTVRTFDLHRGVWSIVWVSSRDGVVEPPVRGGFDQGTGTFYGEAEVDGRPVGVRFSWTRQGPSAARWSQAFTDRENPWHTNWVMDFSR